MGLFGLFGQIITLPVKVVSAPVRVVEKLVEDRPYLQPINNLTKNLTDTIEQALEELDE